MPNARIQWFTPHVRRRFSREGFSGLPLTILCTVLLFLLALLLAIIRAFLNHDPLLALDATVINTLYAFRGPALLNFFYFVTFFGQDPVVSLMGVCLAAFLLLKKQYPLLLVQAISLALAESAAFEGKLFFQRARPDVVVRAVQITQFSFPSGHATTAAVFFGFLVYLIFRSYSSWKIRIPTVIGASLIILLVDLSRMYLGVHYLSDVIAGNLVGIGSLLLAVVIMELVMERRQLVHTKAFRAWHLLVLCLLGIVFAVVYRTMAPLSAATPAPVPEQDTTIQDIPSLFATGKVPTSTTGVLGNTQEPLNLVGVATDTCAVADAEKAGWKEVDWSTPGAIMSTFGATVLHFSSSTPLRLPLFYNSRPNDRMLENQLTGTRRTEHLRFWKTGYKTPEGSVIAGLVTDDAATSTDSNVLDTFIADLAAAGAGESTTSTFPGAPFVVFADCH